jgi:hypothetical protein
MARRRLYEIAHARSGDKGDVSNLSLIPFDAGDYAAIVVQVTAARVAEHFVPLGVTEVERYEMPGIHALNFVLRGALGGGVTVSLRLDPHGKSLSYALLELDIDI